MQDEYVKIGLRRLKLAEKFKGVKLEKEIRTLETDKINFKKKECNELVSIFVASAKTVKSRLNQNSDK